MGSGTVTFKVEGLVELDAALQRLGTDTANRVGRKALRAAAVPIRGHAESLLHSITGALAGSIVVRAGRVVKGYASMAVSAGRWGKKDDPYYAGMVEFGHKKVSEDTRKIMWIRKKFAVFLKGKNKRSMEYRGFIRNQLAAYEARVVEIASGMNRQRQKEFVEAMARKDRIAEQAEFGSMRVPPHPFLRPAFDYQKNQALAIIMVTLREELEKQQSKWTRAVSNFTKTLD